MDDHTTLLYPGIGYDELFLQCEPLMAGKTTVVGWDILPRVPHYTPGQVGYKYAGTPQLYFAALVDRFGPELSGRTSMPESEPCALHFQPRRFDGKPVHVTLHLNTDVNEDSFEMPPGDVLFCGYHPKNLGPWLERRCWVSCGTWSEPLVGATLCHIAGDNVPEDAIDQCCCEYQEANFEYSQ